VKLLRTYKHLDGFYACLYYAALNRSPPGRRSYDLRHAAVSLWLNSGVPTTDNSR
jgi:hypothetical protein